MATVFVGLGSNEGNREAHLRAALSELSKCSDISVTAVSSFHETAPAGGPPQSKYLNAVAKVETRLLPMELLAELQRIEASLGRERGIRWGARTIDLDIIAYDEAVVETDELRIPHPLMYGRLFVLEPLAEIAPTWKHPLFGKTVAELLDELRRNTMRGLSRAPCYIAVAGPIAAGKTTLALLLAARMELVPVLEQARQNPLLGPFYADRKKHALSTQLWFLIERAAQLREAESFQPRRFVTDYIFEKDLIFAKLNLSGIELETYTVARSLVAAQRPQPDLIIYLRASPEHLRRRVETRGRPYESHMPPDYLAMLAEEYDLLFAKPMGAPVIRVQTDDAPSDFMRGDGAFGELLEQIADIQAQHKS